MLTTKILSIDTETTSAEPMEAELVGMSFSDTENQAYYVPVPAEREEALKIVNEFRRAYEKFTFSLPSRNFEEQEYRT